MRYNRYILKEEVLKGKYLYYNSFSNQFLLLNEKNNSLLVNVDIDYVKSQGKSLVTPIVFTDGRKVELLQENVAVKAGDENIIKL